jgi:hypothetical protein
MLLHQRILTTSGKFLLYKLSGILFDFQSYFTAGYQGKCRDLHTLPLSTGLRPLPNRDSA